MKRKMKDKGTIEELQKKNRSDEERGNMKERKETREEE